MNVAELERANLEAFGEYEALILPGEKGGEDQVFTNKELAALSSRLARNLLELGVKRGDRVVVYYPNAPEVLISYAACWKIGAVVVPVLFLLPEEELTFLLQKAAPRACVTDAALLWKVEPALKKLPEKPLLLLGGGGSLEAGGISLHQLLREGRAEPVSLSAESDELAVLLFTSGTTGDPKGVMLSHGNLYATAQNARATRLRYAIESERATALTGLPISHAFGLFLTIGGWLGGGKSVLLPWFESKRVLQCIEKYRVEGMAGVPTMFWELLHFPHRASFDTSSLRACLCGGAPLTLSLKRSFEEAFSAKLYVGYGLSETCAAVTFTPPDMPEEKVGSVGLPLEGVSVAIWDEKGEETPLGAVGEVVVKSPGVMLGFYQMPEKTAEVLRHGWLRTGDLGYLDADGYLFLVERKRDLIIRGGFNIFPQEIENVLSEHPKVSEVAVLGMPDERLGEEVCAFVVAKPGEQPSFEELRDYAAGKLSKNRVPKKVIFRPYLPKNPLGKVLKKELRKLF